MKIGSTVLIIMGLCHLLYAQKPDAIKEYNAGLEYYNLHNYKDAIPFFQTAVKKDPTFVYAFRVLISCQEQVGNIKAAASLYEKVVELSPSDKKVCYNLALTYIDLKDYNKAALYLKKAIKIDAAYAKAAKKLEEIDAYLAKQREKENKSNDADIDHGDSHNLENQSYSKALKLYQSKNYQACLNELDAYDGEITNPNFPYLKAIALQHDGDRESAIEAYEEALLLDDHHFNTNLNLGQIYYNDRKFEDAIHLLETAYYARKNDMKLLYSLAKANFYAKEYQDALPYFEEYTKRNYNEGEAWKLLGDTYNKLGKSKAATEAYEKAKKYNAGNDDLHDHLENMAAKYGREASEYTKKGNYEKAITILEKAITEHSDKASLHFNLGLNYMEVGNTKKAREEFKKTIDLEPAHAKAYQGLGRIYYERGEFKEAGAYYLATIDAGKHDEFVYYKLGSCWFKLQRYQKGIDAYAQAISLNPKEKRYHFGIGLSYLALDRHTEAMSSMEKALALDANFLDAHYHICVSLIKTSEYDACIEEAENILKKDSQYAKAYLIIGHAHKRMGNYRLAEDFQKKAVRLDPTLKQ